MGCNEANNDCIKSVIRSFIPDAEIMLFGSRARKEEHTDSDYDILIITERAFASGEKTTFRSRIRKQLLQEGIRTDILIQNRADIDKKRKLPGHIIRNILKEAVML
jgi:predicted nucleotidyltransferase